VSDIVSLPYRDSSDLPRLVAFASNSLLDRFPLPAAWHPGDIVWALKPDFNVPHAIYSWGTDSQVEAMAMFDGPGEVWIEARRSGEILVEQIVLWAEQKHRTWPSDPRAGELSIRAFDSDKSRIEKLEILGYRKSRPDGVWFRMNLAKAVPTVDLPAEFRVLDCIGVDPADRAKAHRDAWNYLAHIGLPDARSSFTAETYLSLREAPVYDPTLDILVGAPDGQFVANCICWADEKSRIGIFEPVGTSAAFRGRRLARFAILEGARRLRARGMRWARVGTAHFNTAAIAAYSSCGFELFDRSAWWTKVLE
jgi:hypothetical protein